MYCVHICMFWWLNCLILFALVGINMLIKWYKKIIEVMKVLFITSISFKPHPSNYIVYVKFPSCQIIFIHKTCKIYKTYKPVFLLNIFNQIKISWQFLHVHYYKTCDTIFGEVLKDRTDTVTWCLIDFLYAIFHNNISIIQPKLTSKADHKLLKVV